MEQSTKMNDLVKFKAWPTQEVCGALMLQYDLTNARNEILNIPFRIVEWCGCAADSEQWNEQDTEIQILMEGQIIFEGVRHCNFAQHDNGYMNYPNLNGLSKCLQRIHELCLEYCRDYR